MDFFLGAGVALVILGLTLPIGLILLALVVVFSGRTDADPGDRRAALLYLAAVSFVASFTFVFGMYGLASSLLGLPLETETFDTSFTPVDPEFDEEFGEELPDEDVVEAGENDDEWRAAVLSGLVVLSAGGLLAFHLPRLRKEITLEGFAESGARKVFAGYLYATCFFASIIALIVVTAAAYAAFASLAPGVASASGEGKRSDGVVSLVSLLVLMTGLATVFVLHFREAVRWRGGGRPVAQPAQPAQPAGPPSGQGYPPPPQPWT